MRRDDWWRAVRESVRPVLLMPAMSVYEALIVERLAFRRIGS